MSTFTGNFGLFYAPGSGSVGDWYNVKNYGAVGNGSTDDTVAINAAATAAAVSGGILYFPESTYIISTPILIGSNVLAIGTGYASHLKIASTVNTGFFMMENTGGTLGNVNIGIRDLHFDGNNTNVTLGAQAGIVLTGCTSSFVMSNWIEHLGRAATGSCYAIGTNGCTDCQIVSNIITDTGVGVNTGTNNAASCSNLLISTNTVVSINRDYAINAVGIMNSVISNNIVNSDKTAINIQNSASNMLINGNRVLGTTTTGGTGHGMSIIGLYCSAVGNQIRGVAGTDGINCTGSACFVSSNDCNGSGATGTDLNVGGSAVSAGDNLISGPTLA